MGFQARENRDSKRKAIGDRLHELEVSVQGLVNELGPALNRINTQIEGLIQVVDAVTEIVGTDKIQQVLERQQLDKDASACKRIDDTVAAAVKTGALAASATVTEKSLVVASISVGGIVQRPGKTQVLVSRLPDPGPWLGKAVGDTVTVDENTDVNVLGVYILGAEAAAVNENAESTP